MTVSKILLSFTVLCAMVACNNSKKTSQSNLHHEERHWSYSGETSPEHWIDIEKKSDCGGKHQSPVNIIHTDVDYVEMKSNLKILYTPTTLISKVDNNGHSIQFNFEEGDSINYRGKTYYLKQIHFHEPSEHKINGVVFPIEMHLVHVNKRGEIAVLAVFGEEGSQSQLFEFFESFLPLEKGETKEIHQKIDLSSLFLKDKHYYSYNGSLTTPPCTENVSWVVFKEPIILSEAEVLKLKRTMPLNNYRNEQDLNGRTVRYNY
ncbi:carbonic anhydrase [Aestuariivivens insulae]|uniref:carbonic anhydrase n=1 Tax=Aestuariivivens insulae TaxID=1621988 RepID=UPI001F580E67|nr:carbonic anhydrase family protein [Aestuariivivens insulae]